MAPIYNLSGQSGAGMDPAAFLNALQTAAKWGSGPGQITPFDLGVNATDADAMRIAMGAQAERDSQRRLQEALLRKQAQEYGADQLLQGHLATAQTALQGALARAYASLGARQSNEDIAAGRVSGELQKQLLANQGHTAAASIYAGARTGKPQPLKATDMAALMGVMKKGTPEDNAKLLALMESYGYKTDPLRQILTKSTSPQSAASATPPAQNTDTTGDSSAPWQPPSAGQTWTGQDWWNLLKGTPTPQAPVDPYGYAKGVDTW